MFPDSEEMQGEYIENIEENTKKPAVESTEENTEKSVAETMLVDTSKVSGIFSIIIIYSSPLFLDKEAKRAYNNLRTKKPRNKENV